MSRYAVFGNPVKHSKSPQIHQLFAEQTGITVDYTAVQVTEDEFVRRVEAFFASDGAGLNITVPYKESAFSLASTSSDRAQLAQAANTLFLDSSGALAAENTDGAGLLNDLANHGIDVRNAQLLILGAGGAVRGALASLAFASVGTITIVNRTLARAEKLVEIFNPYCQVTARTFADLDNMPFDVIINGTSLSLAGELPPVPKEAITPNTCCYDMMYSDNETVFQRFARQHGAQLALDGLGMLVEQAAESFAIWHGVRPQTAPVLHLLQGSPKRS